MTVWWVVAAALLLASACTAGDEMSDDPAGAGSSPPQTTTAVESGGAPPADLRDAAAATVAAEGVSVHRIVVDGDLVAVHYEVAPTEQHPAGLAAVEVVSFDPGGSIVGQSTVRQPLAGDTVSGRTMFDGGGDVTVERDLDAQRAAVRRLYLEGFATGDAAVIDDVIGPDYAQHNPGLPDGTDGLKAVVGAGLAVEIEHLIAEGDLVVAVVSYGFPAVDIFRFDEDGRIVEHWDVLQIGG